MSFRGRKMGHNKPRRSRGEDGTNNKVICCVKAQPLIHSRSETSQTNKGVVRGKARCAHEREQAGPARRGKGQPGADQERRQRCHRLAQEGARSPAAQSTHPSERSWSFHPAGTPPAATAVLLVATRPRQKSATRVAWRSKSAFSRCPRRCCRRRSRRSPWNAPRCT